MEAMLEDGMEIPEPDDLENFYRFNIKMPETLQKNLSEHSKKEGISFNEYCLYLLTRNEALEESQAR